MIRLKLAIVHFPIAIFNSPCRRTYGAESMGHASRGAVKLLRAAIALLAGDHIGSPLRKLDGRGGPAWPPFAQPHACPAPSREGRRIPLSGQSGSPTGSNCSP